MLCDGMEWAAGVVCCVSCVVLLCVVCCVLCCCVLCVVCRVSCVVCRVSCVGMGLVSSSRTNGREDEDRKHENECFHA